MSIRSYLGLIPKLESGVYVDETAIVIGDVSVGADSSIWPLTAVRGDVNKIRIGSRTNIQDGSVLHVTHSHETIPGGFGLNIGDNVTVGHKVILHGCTVEDNCLIGMGCIVMDGAIIRSNVLLGAGSLVPPGKELASGFLWLGSPVKQLRALKDSEFEWLEYSASHYVDLKNKHMKGNK